MKALLIIKHDPCGCSDYDAQIGVFLDIDKGNEYINNLNIPHDKELELYKQCYECTGEQYYQNDEPKEFKLRKTCDRCEIKTDRHGEYCENEISDIYELKSDSYSGYEIDVIG